MVKNREIVVKHLGLIDYKTALEVQENCYSTLVEQKYGNFTVKKAQPSPCGYLLFCQHPPVYTIGRRGSINHLLVDEATLQKQAIALYHTNRGGGYYLPRPRSVSRLSYY